jgi:apolipoprotein N-acyltransferase
VLVWPESAFPYALARDAGTLAAIAALLPPETVLVTGAYREEASRAFNTIYVIGDDGTIGDAYDKRDLVPFGEYLPFASLFERLGVRQLTPLSFAPGPSRHPLALPSGRTFLPLICYEAIFSGRILDEGARPDFLLNVTNDGWFGRTPGPYQHFHQARLRSVEEGLPLARAANTGISAIVDSYGRIVTATRLDEAAVIQARLPLAIAPPPAAHWPHLIFFAISALCAAPALIPNLNRARER